jgi:mannosyltransferase OCH1-like enzyme
VIHRVWLGSEPMPAEQQRLGASFAERHPRWQVRLWTDADLPELGIAKLACERARSLDELSNLVRYEVLQRCGGVYVDADLACLRDLTPLLRGIEAFAVLTAPDPAGMATALTGMAPALTGMATALAGTAVLGAVPGHPLFVRAARLAHRTLGLGERPAEANGPYMLSLLLQQEPGIAIFGASALAPYLSGVR